MIKRETRDELHIEQSKSACCQSFWDFSRALLCSVMFTLGFNILLFSIFKSLSVSVFTVTAVEAPIICVLILLFRGKRGTVAVSLYCAAVFLFSILFFGSIRSGLDALTNDCIALLIKLTGKIHLDVQSEPADTLPFLILLCSIISAASAKLFSSGRRIAAYAVILFGTVLSASGIAQSPVGAVLIIASGITHLAAGSLSVPHFQKKGAKLTCAVVPLLLASAVLLGSLPMRSFCSNSRLNALSSSLSIWLHRAVYDETTNSMPEGRLSPLRARNTSETPAIAVTSETIQSGYFRGMVGEVYTGTSWESLPNKELAKYNDLFYWLHSDGFFAQSQLSSAAAAVGADGGNACAKSKVDIELISACRRYLYLPYNAAAGKLLDEDRIGDSACIRKNNTGRVFSIECSSVPSAPQLRRMLKDTNGDSVEKYLSDERAYAQFVYETSLLLTPEATAAMAEIFGEAPPALALSDILPLVLSALKENITYDETVKTDCGTNDFAAYVLRVGKRGYSVHYAACAAVMLRYFGVPSRYVEGYYINAETAAARSVSGRVVLTEADAHAWAEYYLDGIGWIPFETTPGFEGSDSAFSGNDRRTDDSSDPSDNTEAPNEPDSSGDREDTYQNDNLPDIRLARPQKNLNRINSTKLAKALILAFIPILLLLTAALIVFLAVRRIRFRRAFKKMLNAEPNEAIALMFGYLNMFMAACGLDISKIDSRYSELNAEAVFSNHKMTAEQKEDMQTYIESEVDKYRSSRSFFGRLRDRYIACVYI